MERTIRKLQRERLAYEAVGDTDKATAINIRINRLKQKYKEFSNIAGLRESTQRMNVDFTNDVANESGISGKKTERTGSNTVDLEYISSNEYHNKFKNITDNDVVNEQIYSQAKAMLTHRNGTNKEDMCLIDSRTGKIVGSQSSSQTDDAVEYNKSLNNAIKSAPKNTLISIHNHATNNPPTGSDFVSAGSRGYKMGIVATHNGKVFSYKVGNTPFTSEAFGKRVDRYKDKSYNEYEAIIGTLKEFEHSFGISWEEYK